MLPGRCCVLLLATFLANAGEAATIEFFAPGTGEVLQDTRGLFGATPVGGLPANVTVRYDDAAPDLGPDDSVGIFRSIGFMELGLGAMRIRFHEPPALAFWGVDDLEPGAGGLGDDRIFFGSLGVPGTVVAGPGAGLEVALDGLFSFLFTLSGPRTVLTSDVVPFPFPTDWTASMVGFRFRVRDPGDALGDLLEYRVDVDHAGITSRALPEPAPGILAAVAFGWTVRRRRKTGPGRTLSPRA